MSETSDKVLSVFLKFGADSASIEKSISEFKKIQTELSALESEAVKLRESLKKSTDATDTSKITQDLKVVEAAISNLKKKADSELGQGLKTSFDEAAQSAVSMGRQIDQAFSLRDVGHKLRLVGSEMTRIGQNITSGLNSSIQAYLAVADQNDRDARTWKEAQASQADSFQRIGAVAIHEFAPYMEKAADLMDKLADFVEKNPEVIKIAAGMGGALMVGGQLVTTSAQLIMAIGSLQSLAGMAGGSGLLSGLGGAASAAGGAAATGGVYGAAAIAGGFIGKGAGNLINTKLLGQQEQSWGDIARTVQELSAMASATGLMSRALKAAGFDDQAAKLWDFTKAMNGLGDAAEQSTQKSDHAKNLLDTVAKDNLQDFIQYEKEKNTAAENFARQRVEIERAAEAKRTDILNAFSEQSAAAEKKYREARTDALSKFNLAYGDSLSQFYKQQEKSRSDFARSEREQETEYYKSRREAASQYNLDVQRSEEDHQRAMLQLQADHDVRIEEALTSRNALAFFREQASYEASRQNAENTYSIEASRKSEDYARQMADLEQNFAEGRAKRLEDFRRQQEEAAANFREQQSLRARDFALQQAEAAKEHAQEMETLATNRDKQLKLLTESQEEQLNKLREGYTRQIQMMQTAFVDRLNALSKSISGDTAAYERYMSNQSAAFQAYLRNLGYGVPSSSSYPYGGPRAAGGSVYQGMSYLVGEQGPELFKPERNGEIIPAGLTSLMLSNRSNSSHQSMNVRIESPSLTVDQILSEMDRRFGEYRSFLDDVLGG